MARSGRLEKWRSLIAVMVTECRARGARDVAYWAQQLAWSPVVPHALSWRLRRNGISEDERTGLIESINLGLAGLGMLPDSPAVSCVALAKVAERQAKALSSGRRRVLLGLSRRLGAMPAAPTSIEVPSRMLRTYDLIGWNPLM